MEIKKEIMAAPVKFVVMETAEVIDELKKKMYSSKKSHIDVKGYRKGKVPQDVAERQIGVEKLYQGIVDSLYVKVAEEENIINAREFKFYSDMIGSKPLKFEFIADVEPTVTLPNLDNIKVERENSDVTDEDVDEAISKELASKKEYVESDKEVVEVGDLCVIDYTGFLEEEMNPFAGGTATDFRLKINPDNKSFIDDFEEQLIGSKVGDEKEIKVEFPNDYRKKEMAGKPARFIVKIKSIQNEKIAELNESFIKDKGFDSIDAYRDFVRSRLQKDGEDNSYRNFKNDIIVSIVDAADISPIPEYMIEKEIKSQWNMYLHRIGRNEKTILKEDSLSKDKFWQSQRDTVIFRLKSELVLSEVSKLMDVTASDEEVIELLKQAGNNLGYSDEQQKAFVEGLKDNSQKKVFEKNAIHNKTVEKLIAKYTK